MFRILKPNFHLLITFILFTLFLTGALYGHRQEIKINHKKFDIIIKNGSVIDGRGNPPYRADVGIKEDKITKIGNLSTQDAHKIIDASGLTICPGFIDLHTHTDYAIHKLPEAHNYIRQGVTTVLGGNCGQSPYLIGEFLDKLKETKIALNFALLVGHNTIRYHVMGNANRPPTPPELEKMKTKTAAAMKEGAFGISTGLKYTPGMYAKTTELVELAKVVKQYGGFYATHMREEGIGVLDSVEETIQIGKSAGLPVHISHHKIASVDRWGVSRKTLAKVDAARNQGLDVTLDQYPYPATSTGLTILFPPWALEGDAKQCIQRWNDPKNRARLLKGIIHNIKHDRGGGDPGRIVMGHYSSDPTLEGMSIKQILINKGIPVTMKKAAEMIVQLQKDALEERALAIYFCLDDEDIERIMRHPYVSHASDGGIITKGKGKPHPRLYGTFPRVLRLYVREKGILTFEEAIRKMTSLPAQRLGLPYRGCLHEGCYADIVILDPATVGDTATWQNPHRYPKGISYVLVNGVVVVKDNIFTGHYPGHILHSNH